MPGSATQSSGCIINEWTPDARDICYDDCEATVVEHRLHRSGVVLPIEFPIWRRKNRRHQSARQRRKIVEDLSFLRLHQDGDRRAVRISETSEPGGKVSYPLEQPLEGVLDCSEIRGQERQGESIPAAVGAGEE